MWYYITPNIANSVRTVEQHLGWEAVNHNTYNTGKYKIRIVTKARDLRGTKPEGIIYDYHFNSFPYEEYRDIHYVTAVLGCEIVSLESFFKKLLDEGVEISYNNCIN